MPNYEPPKRRSLEYVFLIAALLVSGLFIGVAYATIIINNFWGHDPGGSRAAGFFFLTFCLGTVLWGLYSCRRELR